MAYLILDGDVGQGEDLRRLKIVDERWRTPEEIDADVANWTRQGFRRFNPAEQKEFGGMEGWELQEAISAANRAARARAFPDGGSPVPVPRYIKYQDTMSPEDVLADIVMGGSKRARPLDHAPEQERAAILAQAGGKRLTKPKAPGAKFSYLVREERVGEPGNPAARYPAQLRVIPKEMIMVGSPYQTDGYKEWPASRVRDYFDARTINDETAVALMMDRYRPTFARNVAERQQRAARREYAKNHPWKSPGGDTVVLSQAQLDRMVPR